MNQPSYAAEASDSGALAAMDARGLDRLLGEAELVGTAGAKTASEADKVELGRLAFSNLLPAVRERICGNELIESLLGKEHTQRNELIIAIAGFLSGVSPVPYVLAAKTLHYGYGQLCPAPAD